jgi:uncharacterized protein
MPRSRASDSEWVMKRADGSVACPRLAVADTVRTRMRGLLGRSGLGDGEGLLIRPTNSVHMFFMRFAIDVVFLDRELVVRKIVVTLLPWRMAACRGSRAALELPAGAVGRRGITLGERLTLEPAGG